MKLSNVVTPPIDTLSRILIGQASAEDWSSYRDDDWRDFVEQSDRHGVAPLVHWTLKQKGQLRLIPPLVSAQLQRSYYRSAAQNALLLHERDRILECLEAQHIPVVVLKGAHLAPSLYPDPALRPFNDLDLLVKSQDLTQVVGAVWNLGYKDADLSFIRPGSALDRNTNKHLLVSGPHGVVVELHWSLVGADGELRSPDPETVWNSTRPWAAGGLKLIPELELLYLCAHLALQHGMADARLIWLYDVHLLASSGQVDWQAALDLARTLQWIPALQAVLPAVYLLFETRLPEGMLQQLRSEIPGPLAGQVYRRARPAPSRSINAWLWWQDYSIGTRLRLVAAVLFPRREYILYRYRPARPWTWPFYYLYRWADITMDVLRTLRHRLSRRGS